MVRPRLTLERLEGDLIKDHVFLKNKATVIDKVRELSTLTGADVVFLAFSPRGIPALVLGQHSNFSDVVTRFSNVHFYDREKRRLDVLQTLKGNFEQRGYNIDLDSLYGNWKKRRIEDLNEESVFLKGHLSELHHKKRIREDPKNITNIEEAKKVQEILQRHIKDLRMRKEQLNYAHSWCHSQVPGGMQQGFDTTTMLTSHVHGGMQQVFEPETMFSKQAPEGKQQCSDPATMFYGNGGACSASLMMGGPCDSSVLMGGQEVNGYGYYGPLAPNCDLGTYFPLDEYQEPNLEFGRPIGFSKLY